MSDNLGVLSTEQVNARSEDLDLMKPIDIVRLMNEADRELVEKVGHEAESIAAAIALAARKLSGSGRLIYIGTGTSGRIGILDAAECPPTFGVPYEKVLGLIAGGNSAITRAIEGAEDSSIQGMEDLKAIGAGKDDVVVAISASGRTPYCLGALEYARKAGCSTISISCNKNARISKLADIAIEIDTGPEILSGSTRLKAGTAQKMVLNMISTASMVMLGKVYRNFMVDMKVTNMKLRDRAIRILMKSVKIENYDQAARILEDADWNVKTAIVMAGTGMCRESAMRLLAENGGFVRKALKIRNRIASV